jgi:drug/metabolite transporter (DMT)-like permease
MNDRHKRIIGLNAAILLWGGTAMFAKGIHLPVTHIICLRSFVAAIALLGFVWLSRGSVRMAGPRHYVIMLALGLLVCGHWLTYFKALKVSSAGVAILALHSYPIMTTLLEPLFFRERLRKSDLGLALVMIAGLLVMTPQFSLTNHTSAGILFGLVSAMFFTARNLLARAYVQTYTGSVLMFWQTLVTGIVLLPWLWLGGPFNCSMETAALLVLLGIVFTALPQTLYTASLRWVSARTVGIIASLLPLYGAVFGYLIHDETISARTAAGGGLVLACVMIELARHVGRSVPPGD